MPGLEVFYPFGNIRGVYIGGLNRGIGDIGNPMAKQPDFHENLRRTHAVNTSSNRAFGLVFTAVFLILALLPLIGGKPPVWWLWLTPITCPGHVTR